MAPSRFFNRLALPVIMLSLCSSGCDTSGYRYSGSEPLAAHPWLHHKKIFIDAGHGGGDPRDRFRKGPNGVTESALNLRVALILADMLTCAGAVPELSRAGDTSITDSGRADKARAFAPDLRAGG
jgi:N-acetylmuramoyl-L-alanine amidase